MAYRHELTRNRDAQTRNYTTDKQAGRQLARADVPFLFKAFESGQAPPPRPGTKKAEEPRAATIHEYLDWTVTSNDAEQVGRLWRGQDLGSD